MRITPRVCASVLSLYLVRTCSETYYVILISKYNQNCLFSHVLHVEQFYISTVYIIRMSFSASNNSIIVVTVVVPRVCVCLFVVFFCRHMHLDPDVRVHRGTENSFIYYNLDFC